MKFEISGKRLLIVSKPMKRRLLRPIAALMWLLAGCYPAMTAQKLSTPVLAPTPIAIIPMTPSVTPTFAPTPTMTPTATLTEIVEIPTATPDIVGTVVVANKPSSLASFLSPNGKWRATVITFNSCTHKSAVNAYEQLKLVQVSNGSERVIDSQLQNCGGLGALGLGGLFWSPNSRYFYYTNARVGMPEGCGSWEPPFIRLDTTDWKVERLGGGPLSPDKTKIVTWQEQELVVWDVNRGEIARATAAVPNAIAGQIAWAPNGQSLVYLQTTLDCFPWGKSYLVRLDLPKIESSLLIESENPSFWSVFWNMPGRIRLLSGNDETWYYNLVAQKLEK